MAVKPQLFFDLDGTLCDSLPGIERGLKFALKENGLPQISEDLLKKMIGIPLQKSLGMFVFQENEVGSDLYLNTIRSFRTYYAEKGIYESQLYHHVPEILAELSEFKDLYLITAKPKELAIEMLKHHKLDCYFQAVGGFEGQPEFAKSRLIESFLHDDNATMIGDKAEDIIAGKDKGLKTVAALYGYGNKRELESVKPDFFIDSPTQLLTLF